MVLLLDIGNTNTHIGLGDETRVRRHAAFPTCTWSTRHSVLYLRRFVGRAKLDGVALCSVVPAAMARARQLVHELWGLDCFELRARTARGVGIDYPKPDTIGPDRLANAVAALHRFSPPVVVVDFGTAVTIDVVNARGKFVGGIIAPGLAVITDYMHERTALLPKLKFRTVNRAFGRSTDDAMRIGAACMLTGLVREALDGIKRELKRTRLTVVATGGYARLICRRLPETTAIVPELTLEGLRLEWVANWLET